MELIQFSSRSIFRKKSNVKLAKEGDNEAFEVLINEQLTALYRVGRGILKSEQDIEDAIQNTILTSFNKLKSLREDKYFKTWLIRILINECNKIYNYNKRDVIEIVEEFYTVDRAENMDLYDAISKLAEELRVTTILYYFEDLTYKEISNVLEVAEGTVKSRLFRSREKLYYNITGENKLDKLSNYWLEADIEFEESILVTGFNLGDGALINDNTYAGMATFYLDAYDGGVIPEVFEGVLDISNIRILNTRDDSKELEAARIAVEGEPMLLNLDSSNIIINEYAINEEIEFEDVKININSAKKSPTGLFLNRPSKTAMPINHELDYMLWDSKKGELEYITSQYEEDVTTTMQYRLPSEDGEVYIIPYVYSAYGGFNSESFRTEKHLLENGKKYDFGDYGTIEIRDIVHEGDETLIKIRTTGYQSNANFHLISDKEYSYIKPAYDKDKKVLGILDMEVTYVFNKLDPNENYYIRVYVDDENTDFKLLTDDIIKLELN